MRSFKKEVVHAIILTITRTIWNMECGKDLAEGGGLLVVGEIDGVKANGSIAEGWGFLEKSFKEEN